ncbi:DUF1593 domain-containing protein [Pleomorphovibrio marinus]|uniref:DUF1593 domain-containing protein n=1 Tax=Pleomorphovibrio marinus TaxID=2164132 RepID=UPI000E0C84E2|nr:DUF1593 domain-containing protein [Pleomorphovibrio marinus]
MRTDTLITPDCFKKLVYLFLFLFLGILESRAQEWSKPKIIVLTDIGGDTDDEQSLSRFLHYADQFEILGLYATSRMGHGLDTRPEIIESQIQAYEKVYPNLRQHAEGFPSPQSLFPLIKVGHDDFEVIGDEYDSEASEHLISTVDNSEETVHIAIWGGMRELYQALWKVKNSRDVEALKQFSEKIQVHAIGDQDRHRADVLKEFKDITFIANGFAWTGFTGVRELSVFRGMYMTGDLSMQDANWVKENIQVSPLGECYQLHGHGTDGMKEGDTPSFLGLINNGLNIPEDPSAGGWGGRFRPINQKVYIDAPDFLDGYLNERHSVSRWRPEFQRDFMARVQWGLTTFEEANHPPVVKLVDHPEGIPIYLEFKANDMVSLNASISTDPDGDELSFHWFLYEEIYKPEEPVALDISDEGKVVSFTMPSLPNGGQLHLILEVSDNGSPALTRYRRVILKNP